MSFVCLFFLMCMLSSTGSLCPDCQAWDRPRSCSACSCGWPWFVRGVVRRAWSLDSALFCTAYSRTSLWVWGPRRRAPWGRRHSFWRTRWDRREAWRPTDRASYCEPSWTTNTCRIPRDYSPPALNGPLGRPHSRSRRCLCRSVWASTSSSRACRPFPLL